MHTYAYTEEGNPVNTDIICLFTQNKTTLMVSGLKMTRKNKKGVCREESGGDGWNNRSGKTREGSRGSRVLVAIPGEANL